MMSPDAALVVCRLLFDAAAIFLWGTSSFMVLAAPARLARKLDGTFHLHQGIAVAVVLAVTIVLLPLRAAIIGDGWTDALDTTTVGAVLFETNIGQAWMAQAVVAALLAAAVFLPTAGRQAAIAIASTLLLATLAIIGHAAMNPGWLGICQRINDIVHLLAAGAWLGALVPVLVILPQLRDPDRHGDAQQALTRFSTIGHFAVAIAIATGIANTYFIVGHLPLDWSKTYQALLSIKIGLVGLMIALALVNRYVLVPKLPADRPRALKSLGYGTGGEIAAGIAVMLLVAWFGTLDPT